MKRGILVAVVFGVIGAANAQVTNYTNAISWDTAVDYYQTISFTGQGDDTQLINQYSGAGVLFDGTTYTVTSGAFSDGFGIDFNNGATGSIVINFASNITAFATDFPGAAEYDLYSGNTLVGSSDQFGGAGSGFFGGVISAQSFNKVLITDFRDNQVFIDNIHYGAGTAAPEPLSFIALGLGVTSLALRRRRSA